MCLCLLTELQYNNASLNCKLHVFSTCAGLNSVQFKRLVGRYIMYIFPHFQAASHSVISVHCFCCIKDFNSHWTLTIMKLCCLKKCKTTEFFCLVHSFHSLSFDKSIASSKTSCPWHAISASSFSFQYPYFLKVILQLLTSSSSSSSSSHYAYPYVYYSFNNMF